MARQGSDNVKGPTSSTDDTWYSHLCFHRKHMGSSALGKEPNSPNQQVLVSSEGSARIKGLSLKIIIIHSSTPLCTEEIKGRTSCKWCETKNGWAWEVVQFLSVNPSVCVRNGLKTERWMRKLLVFASVQQQCSRSGASKRQTHKRARAWTKICKDWGVKLRF